MCKSAFAQGLNMGKRGKGDGNAIEQLWGVVGEVAVKNYIFEISHSFNECSDGGYDLEYLGAKVDIKTKRANSVVQYHFEHNVLHFQKNYDLDGYIFVRINTNNLLLTVCGICYKDDFFKIARCDKAGTYKKPDRGEPFLVRDDMYSIYYNQIKDVSNAYELRKLIYQWQLKRIAKS